MVIVILKGWCLGEAPPIKGELGAKFLGLE